MALLKIARMGHPVLRRPANPVFDPTAPEIRRLVEDMTETMIDAGGIGLAAPQVHVPLRLVIYGVPPARAAAEEPESGDIPFTVLINPKIEPLSEDRAVGVEGCLSIPGMIGQVPRWTSIRVTAQGLDGETVVREVQGFHARVIQHECDHLDGTLYPMRIEDMATFGFIEEFRKGGEHMTATAD